MFHFGNVVLNIATKSRIQLLNIVPWYKYSTPMCQNTNVKTIVSGLGRLILVHFERILFQSFRVRVTRWTEWNHAESQDVISNLYTDASTVILRYSSRFAMHYIEICQVLGCYVSVGGLWRLKLGVVLSIVAFELLCVEEIQEVDELYTQTTLMPTACDRLNRIEAS